MAKRNLTAMQKELLCLLAQRTEQKNMTQTVNKLRLQLACAPSTLWNNMRVLREIGLIEGGSRQEIGKAVQLTIAGRLIQEKMQKDRVTITLQENCKKDECKR